MKEATSEVSGTVITIILIAAVLGVAGYFFTAKGEDGKSIAAEWIENIFTSKVPEAEK